MKTKITLALLMCGIGAVAASSLASAATPDLNQPTIVVKYVPAELATYQGARRLYARLSVAAAEVCPNYGSPHWITRQVKECREQAISNAVANVHNPRLAAVLLSSSDRG
jgi:UrcA family protein